MTLPEGLADLVGTIPEIEAYPTMDDLDAWIDALSATHPDTVSVRRIGTSRNGDPLRMITVGDGTVPILVYAGPHPNEPIGFRTVQELLRLLLDARAPLAGLDARWHVVPCVDPDGARLNEAWYDRPGDRRAYARGYYRPALDDQVEWTFPYLRSPGYFDRVLPETAALVRVMDEVKPALLCSLHNAEDGGVFSYVTSDDAALAQALSSAAGIAGLPVQAAVWEVPASSLLAPGVIAMPQIEEYAGSPFHAAGASGADYARRYGTVAVVTEVPSWADPRAGDTHPCGETFGAVVARALTALDERADRLRRITDAAEPVAATPFRVSLNDLRASTQQVRDGWRGVLGHPEMREREATVAESSAFAALPHMIGLRGAGTLCRVLDAEIAVGNLTPAVRTARRDAIALFDEWVGAAESLPAMPVAPRRQVATQLAVILSAASVIGSGKGSAEQP